MNLIPMSEEDFAVFFTHSVAGYAADMQRTYAVPAELALASATADFNDILPDGRQTADHHLYRLCSPDDTQVGVAWIGIQRQPPLADRLFVYDLEIHEAYRRQGWARQALQAIESWALQRGIERMELNVFAHNEAALALYRSVGMTASEMTMGKDLRRDGQRV